jgi:hypothetical protein
MRMKALSSSVSAFSWLLASVCLRYGVAKPSVWPCGRACKQRQFSGLRSDSPLNFTPFWFRFGDASKAFRVCRFLVLQSSSCCVSACTLEPLTTAGWSSVCFSWGFRCLVLRWKACVNPLTVGCTLYSRVRQSGMSVSAVVRINVATGNDAHEASTSRVGAGSMLIVGAIHRPSRTDRKELNMYQSRGAVSFTPLFTTDDIGLRKDASVEHVVKVFLTVGEAIAARWIEMPRGILLLQTVPEQSASGAIYLYDRERHIFFFIDFVSGRNDALTATEFDQLVAEYDLVSWTANPAQLPSTIRGIGMA